MKKIFMALFVAITLLVSAPADAAVQTYEGVGEYVMSEFETKEIAVERAKHKAICNVQKMAGVYLKAFSRSMGSSLTDDEIAAITANAIEVIDVKHETQPFSVGGEIGLIIKANVKVKIDPEGITEWLNRNESEREAIIAQNKNLQREFDENDRQLAELKKKLAETERIAKETPKEIKPVSTQQNLGQIFEGVGEYRMGSSETIINAEKGAKILAMQDALERAGILVDHYAKVKDFELDKSIISAKSRVILKVIDTKPEWKDFVCRTTIKVDINVAELNKWLEQEAKKST